LITPAARRRGRLPTLRKLIDWQSLRAPTASAWWAPRVNRHGEHSGKLRGDRVSVEQAAGSLLPIHGCCGSNCTAEAIEMAVLPKVLAPTCQLQVRALHNKPHRKASTSIQDHRRSVDLPMVLYNVPGRQWLTWHSKPVLRWLKCLALSASRKPPATLTAPC